MLRQFLVACALALLALPACAQTPERGVQRGMTLEVGGGFDYTKFDSTGGLPNQHGVYGSLALNVTRSIQVYAEGSEQFGTVPDGNTRLFGDHGGIRYYYRPRYLVFNPFAEGLLGFSRLDLNLKNPTQRFSDHGFSFRIGGGLDLAINRHWSVRAFNADYYRTPFLQTHQNNLWLSAGIIFKFGERAYPR